MSSLSIFTAFVSQIVVGLLIAWVSVRLALDRFRQERWWDKKYEAYSEILNSLHKMKRSFDDDFEMAIQGREQSPEQREKSRALWEAGNDEARRYADLADFMLSDKSCEILKQFGADILKAPNTGTYQEFLDDASCTVGKAIVRLKAAAKTDLAPNRPLTLGSAVRKFWV